MVKLAHILKELNATKNLLLEQYGKNDEMRQLHEKLRDLNSKLAMKRNRLENTIKQLKEEIKELKKIVGKTVPKI